MRKTTTPENQSSAEGAVVLPARDRTNFDVPKAMVNTMVMTRHSVSLGHPFLAMFCWRGWESAEITLHGVLRCPWDMRTSSVALATQIALTTQVHRRRVTPMAHRYAYEAVPAQEAAPTGNRHWRPKLTGYRFLVIASTVAFGVPKAVATYHGKVILPIYLEWSFGVVVTLALYFGSLYERNNPEMARWLFQKDYASYIGTLLESFHLTLPACRTDEVTDALLKRDRLPLTPYRLLVSAVVIIGGTMKIVVSLQGHATAATTLDWSLGVVLTIFLYCLGLYECNSTGLWSTFFTKDCRSIVLRVLRSGLLVFFSLPLVGIIYLSTIWTSMWVRSVAPIWTKNYGHAGIGSRIGAFLGQFAGSLAAMAFADLGIIAIAIATLSLCQVIKPLIRLPAPRFLSPLIYFLVHVEGILLCIGWSAWWGNRLRAFADEIWLAILLAFGSSPIAFNIYLSVAGAIGAIVVFLSLILPLSGVWTDRPFYRLFFNHHSRMAHLGIVVREAAISSVAIGLLLAFYALVACSNDWFWPLFHSLVANGYTHQDLGI